MRVAINSPLWNGYAKLRKTELDPRQFLAEAAEMGYAGVELGNPYSLFGNKEGLLNALREHKLELASLFAGVTYNPHQPNIDEYRQRIDEAADLGIRTICVCGGFMWTGRRNTIAADYDLFASSIGPMVDYAGERGCVIAFHPHRGCIVETIDETHEILQRVPNLRLCIDTGHLEACGEDARSFARTFADKIVYTHIKDYHWQKETFAPPGQGDGRLDVAACVRDLQQAGYDGWLTVELDRKWADGDPEPRSFAKICREYLANRCGI